MNRHVKKVAVLGSGIMGSRIACHLAGAGLSVLLLDIIGKEQENSEKKSERNRWVNEALQSAVKSNPSPLYHPELLKNISTGNFTDDLPRIADCDWIIEVVVERLDIKKQLFDQVEQYRKSGTLISSNTSGIPISMMVEGRSEDFKKHFCGTHFFNPPRYLRLLEIIPTVHTDPEVVQFFLHFGELILGKATVLCKDTPAFIANRVGVFSMLAVMNTMEQLSLSIDEIEFLTGTLIGRPKSATFRTADVVGLDTLIKVADGIVANCPKDEAKATLSVPAWVRQMQQNAWLGDKTGQGFFKKIKKENGEKEILTLDRNTMEYRARVKPAFPELEPAKALDDLHSRLQFIAKAKGKAGDFFRTFHYALFAYVSHRVPEISDTVYRIDDAMKHGFGWGIGAFETWDLLGVEATVSAMKAAGYTPAPWVDTMLQQGSTSFYQLTGGQKKFYDIAAGGYVAVSGDTTAFIVMKDFADQTLWKNSACRLYHLGEDVLGLEWNTKMNTIGGEVLSGIQTSIEKAEKDFKGLVIANEGANFSAGANIGMIFMLAAEQEYEELDLAVRFFQQTVLRARYAQVPVVVAPHGLVLGGSCELSLHATACCAAAETYTGLVELGVGLIPGGGGTKEFVLRAADEMHPDEPETITLKNRFLTIATAKVSTSAKEAFDLGIYRKGVDQIVMNQSRRISVARDKVIDLYDRGYVMPVSRKEIRVLGQSALGALYAGIHGMWRGGYATDHDVLVAKKLAYIMCGGDLSEPTWVSEQYLLDLEREAFLSLCGERKTLERLQSVLKGGKPVRN
ncbi:MAG: enoyl-CoA hydratase/isomerase family protein [Bacteroidetes bacterium]|nr:enoyl-CoA hydratase/isomerase family protein [Bacteroidota bacterium]